jgi:hypothetical protein
MNMQLELEHDIYFDTPFSYTVVDTQLLSSQDYA